MRRFPHNGHTLFTLCIICFIYLRANILIFTCECFIYLRAKSLPTQGGFFNMKVRNLTNAEKVEMEKPQRESFGAILLLYTIFFE